MWTVNEKELEKRRAEWRNDREIVEQILGKKKAEGIVLKIYNLTPNGSQYVRVGGLKIKRTGLDYILGDEYPTKGQRMLVTHPGSGFGLDYLVHLGIVKDYNFVFQEWLWSGLATLLFCFDQFYEAGWYYSTKDSREMRCALRNPLRLMYQEPIHAR